ncbi:hypothetical protein ACHAPT_012560 [Fusarium lateritium]
MPTELTTTVRRDHTRWECRRDSSIGDTTCGAVMDMTVDQCEGPTCGALRGIGDYALNRSSEKIGELMALDNMGTEYWVYDEVLVNDVS